MLFNITYEIVTDESAEHGDAEERGFIAQAVSLREAIELVQATRDGHSSQEGIEASDSCVADARWITVYNSMNYISGDVETRSLHFPDNLSGATRVRIAQMLNCYGV